MSSVQIVMYLFMMWFTVAPVVENSFRNWELHDVADASYVCYQHRVYNADSATLFLVA